MPFCLWFTGIPAAGKTTLALETIKQLQSVGVSCSLVDADPIRRHIYPDLGFSEGDRAKNIERLASIASLVLRGGGNACVAAVSPYREARKAALQSIGPSAIELHVHCSKEEAARRDPARKYWASADAYEPSSDSIVLDTMARPSEELGTDILSLLREGGLIPSKGTLFIGRWSPFHMGHKHIIDEAMKEGSVVIGVRATPLTKDDPWTPAETVQMIRAVYPSTYVFICPDISALAVGRTPGYELKSHIPGEDITKISGTEVRELIASNDPRWRDAVPSEVMRYLKKRLL